MDHCGITPGRKRYRNCALQSIGGRKTLRFERGGLIWIILPVVVKRDHGAIRIVQLEIRIGERSSTPRAASDGPMARTESRIRRPVWADNDTADHGSSPVPKKPRVLDIGELRGDSWVQVIDLDDCRFRSCRCVRLG